eukprot:1426190-Rhodomonas_salina.1
MTSFRSNVFWIQFFRLLRADATCSHHATRCVNMRKVRRKCAARSDSDSNRLIQARTLHLHYGFDRLGQLSPHHLALELLVPHAVDVALLDPHLCPAAAAGRSRREHARTRKRERERAKDENKTRGQTRGGVGCDAPPSSRARRGT